jgi:hypothetical protein
MVRRLLKTRWRDEVPARCAGIVLLVDRDRLGLRYRAG